MKVGIIQPNYIPWRGYFDFISKVDMFVFFDDVQYTKRDWRNRNRVRLSSGDLSWLSVPVNADRETLIMDAGIDHSVNWASKHLSTLEHNYRNAPYYGAYIDEITRVIGARHPTISDLDIELCEVVCGWLGIDTPLVRASGLKCPGVKDEKLIRLVQAVGGTDYLSGPAARAYIQPDLWEQAGIGLEFITYPEYPAYPQIAEGFEPAVSVLDLLFMTGPEAPRYIWG